MWMQPGLNLNCSARGLSLECFSASCPFRERCRLLQVSPEEARRVICAPKEVVEEFQEEAQPDLVKSG